MIKSIFDVETGEYLEVELTAEEIAAREAKQELINAAKAAILAKRESALAKLSALGLDEDDLRILGLQNNPSRQFTNKQTERYSN